MIPPHNSGDNVNCACVSSIPRPLTTPPFSIMFRWNCSFVRFGACVFVCVCTSLQWWFIRARTGRALVLCTLLLSESPSSVFDLFEREREIWRCRRRQSRTTTMHLMSYVLTVFFLNARARRRTTKPFKCSWQVDFHSVLKRRRVVAAALA